MLTSRLQHAVIGLAAVASLNATVAPTLASATAPRQPATVRNYDHRMLLHTNRARARNHVARLTMSSQLHTVAQAWAQHLAKTRRLVHNPKLQAQVSKRCPHWTAIGENIAYGYGHHPGTLFRAYMRSPGHRANILDDRYTQVGIATVTLHRRGQAEQWNVMDFANHC
jgi:uncharacterized protein YkwD